MFIVSELKEDAILGMPFLKIHKCHIDVSKSAVVMAGHGLTCVNEFSRPLEGGVQVIQNCTIPRRSHATIHCRVNSRRISGLGVVEGAHDRIELASSLNQLTPRGEILVQCINPFMESVELPVGSMVGRFHFVQEGDVGPSLDKTMDNSCRPQQGGWGLVQTHVKDLYKAACQGCVSNEDRLAMAKLLREYKDVFSSEDHDVGLTQAVCHEISLAARTVLIRQPTRRLGPEKEKEVSRQIRDLIYILYIYVYIYKIPDLSAYLLLLLRPQPRLADRDCSPSQENLVTYSLSQAHVMVT